MPKLRGKSEQKEIVIANARSLAKTGSKNPMYGKPLTPEIKEKISIALKRKFSEIGGGMTGKHHTEETKRHLSIVSSGEKNHRFGKTASEETRKKIGLKSIGRPKTEDGRKRISEANSGDGNGNWQGGFGSEPYNLEFRYRIAKQIRNRDNHNCQLCGVLETESGRDLDVHHIDSNPKNDDWLNLISLCRHCHANLQVDRNYWQVYFIKRLSG